MAIHVFGELDGKEGLHGRCAKRLNGGIVNATTFDIVSFHEWNIALTCSYLLLCGGSSDIRNSFPSDKKVTTAESSYDYLGCLSPLLAYIRTFPKNHKVREEGRTFFLV